MHKFTFSNLTHKNNQNQYLIKHKSNINVPIARELLPQSKNVFIVNDFKRYKYIDELISYYVINNTFDYNKFNNDLANVKINKPEYYTSFYHLHKQTVLEYFLLTDMEIIILK